jgi:hypothetical protein
LGKHEAWPARSGRLRLQHVLAGGSPLVHAPALKGLEAPSTMNHFTNQGGYNAIGSQPTWNFKAYQPLARHHPVGAYFTTYPPTESNLAKKLYVSKGKLSYVFSFAPPQPLQPLPGGRGRLERIFFSPTDYPVPRENQDSHGPTGIQ